MLKPVLGTIKRSFYLEDEKNNIVYEGNMIKFSLLFASLYEFINHLTGKREEHKVGKTITLEESGVSGFFSTKSRFKFDGKNIWDYLHNLGVRIESKLSSDKIGMTYVISFEGKEIATVASSSPKGKSIITTDLFYDVIADEKDLDLVFLVAFAIAKTDQLTYD